MFRIDSQLKEVALKNLRPTQLTVGLRAVEEKRREWAELPAKRRRRDMGERLFPAVKGPKEHLFIIDHHHLALALHEIGERGSCRVGGRSLEAGVGGFLDLLGSSQLGSLIRGWRL
jgi:hypothetical protein